MGRVNGYIEEMIVGQKVVKVFCHESKAKQEFDALNDELCHAATNANTFANILMPIMGNLSYIHYAVTAIAGAVGAGGLGDLAIRYGYQRRVPEMMWVTVIFIIVLVQIIQSLFSWLSTKLDKRLR